MIRILTALRLRAMLPQEPVAPTLASIIARRGERLANRNRAAANAFIARHAVLARGRE